MSGTQRLPVGELRGKWVAFGGRGEGGERELGRVVQQVARPGTATDGVKVLLENGRAAWRELSAITQVFGTSKPSSSRSAAGAAVLALETQRVVKQLSPERFADQPTSRGGPTFHLLPGVPPAARSRVSGRAQALGRAGEGAGEGVDGGGGGGDDNDDYADEGELPAHSSWSAAAPLWPRQHGDDGGAHQHHHQNYRYAEGKGREEEMEDSPGERGPYGDASGSEDDAPMQPLPPHRRRMPSPPIPTHARGGSRYGGGGSGGGGSGSKPWGDNKVSREIPAWMRERRQQAQQAKLHAAAVSEDGAGSTSGSAKGHEPASPRGKRAAEGAGSKAYRQGAEYADDDEATWLAGALNQRSPGQPSLGTVDEDADDFLSVNSASTAATSMAPGTPPPPALSASAELEADLHAQAQARRVLRSVVGFGDSLLQARVGARLTLAARAGMPAARPVLPPVPSCWKELGRTEALQDTLCPRFAVGVRVQTMARHQRQRGMARWVKIALYDVDGDANDALEKHDLVGEAILRFEDWLAGHRHPGVAVAEAEAEAAVPAAGQGGLVVHSRVEAALRRPNKAQSKSYGRVRLVAERTLCSGGGGGGGGAVGAAGVVRVSVRARGLINVEGWIGKSDPFLVWRRGLPPAATATAAHGDGGDGGDGGGDRDAGAASVVVHRTEWVKSDLNPIWQPFELQMDTLCNGDRERLLHLEVFDYEKSGKHRVLGRCTTSVAELLTRQLDARGQTATAGAAGQAQLQLQWPADGGELQRKAGKKGKDGPGVLLFDAFNVTDGGEGETSENTGASHLKEFLLSVECEELANMDRLSKTDPMAVISLQDTRPVPPKRHDTFVGKLDAKANKYKTSLATILRAT